MAQTQARDGIFGHRSAGSKNGFGVAVRIALPDQGDSMGSLLQLHKSGS